MRSELIGTRTQRIAKNTLLLYFRMAVVTLVGLYTSRVILQSLGASDFGLYNVIGGVVTLFAFFRSSMEKFLEILNQAMIIVLVFLRVLKEPDMYLY